VSDCCPSSRVPCGWEAAPPFIDQGGCSLHARFTISMCSGMANSAAKLTAVLANPAPFGASWCVLCSYRSGFEGCGAVVGWLAAVVGQFEDAVDGEPVRGTVAVVAKSCPRTSQQRRDVATASGVVRQWRGWPHRADNDGDDRSRRPDVTAWSCIST
jgi:hypothetical protein